jgi:hypothetical protein
MLRERIAKKRAVFQGAYRQRQNSTDRVIAKRSLSVLNPIPPPAIS